MFIFQKCSNLTEIDKLNDSGVTLVEKITTSYLNNDIPVVVENISGSRPITEVLTVEKLRQVLYDFLGTVKAAPHECVIRTGQPFT